MLVMMRTALTIALLLFEHVTRRCPPPHRNADSDRSESSPSRRGSTYIC
jgi:hypothetical protein